ncbi:MAG TPA: glucose 1-dehydrogenase [Candidatus Limnocylindria bacterium]|nr:glucose 1-dehydrogenase [Candidatus Limnocylindria bacterium]
MGGASRVAGKVAIVTGGTRGIGRACAERLAEDGALVVVGDIVDPVSPFSDPNITFRKLDVSSESSWTEIVAHTVETHGRLDILVNNAGVIKYAAVDSCSVEDWHASIAVNETGVFLGMRAVIPEMRKQGGGSIVNVSSIWGSVAVAGAIGYHASKGAVTVMTRSAALSLIPDNIRVNSVHPGFIDTPLTQAQDPDINTFVIGLTPMGRAGKPREIANGVLFLASDEASFVTGTGLFIDGGYTAQ